MRTIPKRHRQDDAFLLSSKLKREKYPFDFLATRVLLKPSMKNFIGLLIILSFGCALAQDTTYFYYGWGKPGTGPYLPKKAMVDTSYTMVRMEGGHPVLLRYYDASNELKDVAKNEYDKYGNHVTRRSYYPSGQLREELIFRNDPDEMALFRTIFGPTFSPANSNFMIRREYNFYGRETGYFIIGVRGETLCSRVTTYREDRRKDREILRDDLKKTILADRRYKYFDDEDRTVLEEFNGAGKLVQRVVLFDHNEIIQE